MNDDDKVAAVVDALRLRGFVFVGPAADGWLKLRGPLQASGTAHACEIQLDPKFFELPRVQLLKLPVGLSRVTPHLGAAGHLCYIAKGTVVLDIFDPVGQTLACIQRAEAVLETVLKGEMVQDLEEEFYAYWGGPLCLVDMQDRRLGRQETLVIKPSDNFTAVVTDDAARTTTKLKALGWDQHWLHYSHALAFCASTVDGKHISSRWQWLAHLRKAQAFRHEDVSRIAAFDLWVENQDRHTGNFLRTRDGT